MYVDNKVKGVLYCVISVISPAVRVASLLHC